MSFTVEQAKRWAEDNSVELDSNRLTCDDESVQMFNSCMPDKSKQLWDSGCWLGERLRAAGAKDDQVRQIQMAQGQRAFCGDAWQAAVDYANEFTATGDTVEKGGVALAVKRHAELFGNNAQENHE